MPIARAVAAALENSSWIRRMFEEGAKLKQKYGADEVFDFSLGNPDLPPPREFVEALRTLTAREPEGIHRYMPNAGWPHVRAKIAAHLASRMDLPYTENHLVMTVGAGGALNVLMKTLLDPGDEVVVLAPYFVEYDFYVANHRGKRVVVQTNDDFGPDPEALRAGISDRTRMIIINSPNNPTGRVYSADEYRAVAAVIAEAEQKYGQPIYLITDEPYRKIVFDGFECPDVPLFHPNTIVATSHSKDLGLAGERIGYLAVSPRAADAELIQIGCTFANRTLGFVNAPSLFQLAIAECLDTQVELDVYAKRKDLLLPHLRGLGFEIVEPGGAFYLFPKAPGGDDVAFCRRCVEERILVVPGSGFGRPGHFRISYAVPTPVIEKSLPAWERVAKG